MKARVEAALAALSPTPFAAGGFEPAAPLETFQAGSLGSTAEIGFDVATGAIIHLSTGGKKQLYASKTNPIGWLWYQGLDQQYFSNFQKAYNNHPAGNFGKPGLTLPAISSNMTLVKLQQRQASGAVGAAFLLELAIASSDSYGTIPQYIMIIIQIRNGTILQIDCFLDFLSLSLTLSHTHDSSQGVRPPPHPLCDGVHVTTAIESCLVETAASYGGRLQAASLVLTPLRAN